MFYLIFFSPQVKRWAIIIYKHGISELPDKLPNGLRLEPSAQSPCQNESFVFFANTTIQNPNTQPWCI